jgi:hypothetical protein
VGEALFREVVLGLLAPHACVLVTHHDHLAQHAQAVLTLDQNGNQLDPTAAAATVGVAQPAGRAVNVATREAGDAAASGAEADVGEMEIIPAGILVGGRDPAATAAPSQAALRSDGNKGRTAAVNGDSGALAWQSNRIGKSVIKEEHREEGNVTFRTVSPSAAPLSNVFGKLNFLALPVWSCREKLGNQWNLKGELVHPSTSSVCLHENLFVRAVRCVCVRALEVCCVAKRDDGTCTCTYLFRRPPHGVWWFCSMGYGLTPHPRVHGAIGALAFRC